MSGRKQIKLSKGKKTAVIATLLTAGLAIIKYIAGIIYNSDILIADAFHSLADTAAIAASAFGLYLAGRARTDRFPYGLYRAETIALLFTGIFISYMAVNLTAEGIEKIISPGCQEKIPFVPAIVVVFSIIVSAFIARRELAVSREINSLSLEANARESLLDLASSIIVLGGIILPSFEILHVEGIAIIIIAMFILKIGVESAWRSILILMDANIHGDLKNSIEDILFNIKGIKAVNGIYIREAGPFKMIDLKIEISPSATVYAANELNEKITDSIFKNLDGIEDVIIDIKPAKNEIYRAVVPVNSCNGLRSIIHPHFGRSKYYAIVTICGREDEIKIEDFFLNEFLDKEKHVGLNVVKALINFNIDVIFTNQIGEISFYILKDNLVDIYRIDEKDITLNDIIKMFIGGKLTKITAPTHPAMESPAKF